MKASVPLLAAGLLCTGVLDTSAAGPIAPFDNEAFRASEVERFAAQSQRDKTDAVAWAQLYLMPVRYDMDGVTRELMRIENGRPIYYSTFNVNAAISTAANIVRDLAAYNLSGSNIVVGEWDVGSVLSSHQEFGGRVTVKDGAASNWHSTHVGGTIAAAGAIAAAKGMAPHARIDSYDWNNDMSEVASRGASAPSQSTKIYLSNHSYGVNGGWFWDTTGGEGWHWAWKLTYMEDPLFGQYNDVAHNVDDVAYNAPYLLIIFASGNSRNDGPASGDTFYYWNGSSYSSGTYNPAVHPLGDGVFEGGCDTITQETVAKNTLTVGAVNDAVLEIFGLKIRFPWFGTISDFSSCGPADDGRIKPDIVGNGVDLYSTHNGGNDWYGTASGTSMASPNVCGSAALLLEQFCRWGGEPRSSTMKAIIIHTADDIGNYGPDYTYGWGLMNTWYAADVIAGDHNGRGVTHIREGLRTDGAAIHEYVYTSAGVSPFKATLCWTDPAGTATAVDVNDDRTAKLVNDLDMRVIGPGSTTFYPFRLSYSAPSATATTGDNARDNVEQVLITNPVAGTYTVRVSHYGALSSGSQYYSLVVTGEPYPLDSPSNIAASDGTYSFTVRVSWDAVAGASSYSVYRSTVNNSTTATSLGSVSGTVYTDAGATSGIVYYYWVKANSTLSDSSFSGSNSGFLAPSMPSGVAASNGTKTNAIDVTWPAVTGATDYKIYRGTTYFVGSATLVGSNTVASFTDTKVVPGTIYYYWVKTVMYGVESYYSNYDPGYALLTITCPEWKVFDRRKTDAISGKFTAPMLTNLLAQGWVLGIGRMTGGASVSTFAGAYVLFPNKAGTLWKFREKNNATVRYAAKNSKLSLTVWTNLPTAWVIYIAP